jgi:hypothetical protein
MFERVLLVVLLVIISILFSQLIRDFTIILKEDYKKIKRLKNEKDNKGN